MDAIIITFTEEEAKNLHLLIKEKWDNLGFWGQCQLNYNRAWYWVYENKELSGSAGYNSYQHTLNTHPLLPSYTFSGFKNVYKK